MADYSGAYMSDLEYARQCELLRPKTRPDSVAAMPPRAEVIEFTHEFTPESTSIRKVWFNQNNRRLTVQFIQGGEYSYDDCSIQRFRALKKAESTGRYIRTNFTAAGKTGAKHGGATVHHQVPIQAAAEVTDLDALKTEKLTNGEGDTFTIHFDFSGKSTVEVRALDVKAAMALFNEYFTKSGLTVKATKAELHF